MVQGGRSQRLPILQLVRAGIAHVAVDVASAMKISVLWFWGGGGGGEFLRADFGAEKGP